MAALTLPSQTYLRQCLDYDPDTGILTWRERPDEHIAGRYPGWNKRFAGKVTGSITRKGYLTVRVDGVGYLAHRLIWRLMTGESPVQIDHVNGSKGDNRWSNLRECNDSQNMMNRPLGGSRSGFRGVRKLKRGGWEVRITKNRVAHHIGSFATFELAKAARLEAERSMFGEFSYQGAA